MTLSVVIPAHNEEGNLEPTVRALVATLDAQHIPHEVVVVDDHSTDGTHELLESLSRVLPSVRSVRNDAAPGFGYAVRAGLDAFTGDAVCIVMADASDDPADVVLYYRELEKGYDCAFGSRFVAGARVTDYPWMKLILNRMANWTIRMLFGLAYNDVTNAFKCFRRAAIDGIRPLLSCHFNLTVELPLKAIVRGYSYSVVPTQWRGREVGFSKLKIKEMGSRYLFIVLYVLLEHWLSRGDYRRMRPDDPVANPRLPLASRPIPRLRDSPAYALFVGCVLVAVIVRLVFWAYTGRVWEDALIALTSARNVWDGYGLTHHLSEPRVWSFTSPLGELIFIAGEALRAGMVTMRAASLLASVFALYFAYRVGTALQFHWAAHLLVLGYLATDHLQVFFGMSGMETQVATALVLGGVHFYLASSWMSLGVATGLALICRPEFALWGLIVAVAAAIWHRRAMVAIAGPALAIAGPWYAFAWWYFGSVIPHTVTVKAVGASVDFNWDRISAYIAGSWQHVAPFVQFWPVNAAPVPTWTLQLVVALVCGLFAAGAVWLVGLQRRMLAPLALLLGFAVYRAIGTVNPYFMWYLPPFTAVLFVFAGGGVSWLATRSRSLGIGIAVVVVAAYAAHLPLTLPLDREVQVTIEDGVRKNIGIRLNALMASDDAVVLEPVGFIGWEVRPKTTYDFPGLSSPIAFASYRRHRQLSGMISDLMPRFVVQRIRERQDFEQRMPAVAARYVAVDSVSAPPDLNERLTRAGLRYRPLDRAFTIYRRVGD